ncbi:hypothetical protein HMPREF0290_2378 [Corynebacterium efficiens YS-314]|nr:hypothetical protein HMPREF0290_2378 [Corynebacterium efficiens YS-314]
MPSGAHLYTFDYRMMKPIDFLQPIWQCRPHGHTQVSTENG